MLEKDSWKSKTTRFYRTAKKVLIKLVNKILFNARKVMIESYFTSFQNIIKYLQA